MKKFILLVLVFFLLVATIDFVFGIAMDYMYFNAIGGREKEMNEVCIKNQYDILVMGSSRARHHYVPEIISDSLGGSCYNTGKDGNGVILMYGIYKMITDRYKPSLIIFDISQGFDIYKNPQDNNNIRYLNYLKPYVKKQHVKDIFMSYSWCEWVKNYSSLYRYNSSLLFLLRDYFSNVSYNIDGYDKLTTSMNYEPEVREKFLNAEVDTFKIEYFKKFILATKRDKIRLICVTSPNYRAKTSEVYLPLKKVCEEYEVPLLDYYTDEVFNIRRDYYKDATHLNDTGARLFTQLLSHDIKGIIGK